jgi:hypothetical protein
MELVDAVRQMLPLQIRIPEPRRPLQTAPHCAAEVFLVETRYGPAVVWLEPFWCERPEDQVCRIAYANPKAMSSATRWVDQDPHYGPRCLAYLKPFVIEQACRDSAVWKDCEVWRRQRAARGTPCGRRAAWMRVKAELSDIITKRLD